MTNEQLVRSIKAFIKKKYGNNLPSFPHISHEDLPDFEELAGLDNQNLVSSLTPLKDAGYITIKYGNDRVSLITINRSFPY